MIPASSLGTGQQLQILFDLLLRQNRDQHIIHEQGLRGTVRLYWTLFSIIAWYFFNLVQEIIKYYGV